MPLNFNKVAVHCHEEFIQTYNLNENSNKQFYFSHANGFNGLTYQSLLRNISKEFRVTTYDMRGHGDTTIKADPRKLKSWFCFRDDLIFLLENSNTPAILSGHSLGGTASWLVALSRPDLVEKLVLVDPVILPLRYIFGYHLFDFFNIAHFISPLAKNALIRRNEWKTKEEAYDYFSGKKLFSKVSKEALNDYVNHGLKHNKNNNLTLKCDPKWESACFQLNTKEVWNGVENLKIPIKIILTKNSAVCNKFSQKRIKKLAPQTEIVFIKKTTHMLPLEASEEVSDEINKFL